MSPRSKRMVAYVSEALRSEKGFLVVMVTEGEEGYRPTGGNGKEPWHWGPTLEDARNAAREFNARMGIDEEDAFRIVARSMAGGRRGGYVP